VPRALPAAPIPRPVKSVSWVLCLSLTASLAGCAAPSLRRAPEIPHTVSFNTHAYEQLSLKALRGKVVMLFFWSAGDVNCRKAILQMNRLHGTYRSRGLEVIGVHSPTWESLEKSAPYVLEKLQGCGVAFPVILDSGNRIKVAYGRLMVPAVFLVDRNGLIRAQYNGSLDFPSIEGMLDQLLTQDGRPAPERLFVPTLKKKQFKSYEEVP